MKKSWLIFVYVLLFSKLNAEDGYRLWLRYDMVKNAQLLQQYRNSISGIVINGNDATILAAKEELLTGLQGLLGKKVLVQKTPSQGSVIIGISNPSMSHNDGFTILTATINGKKQTQISGKTSVGVLYGVFEFLRLIQTNQPVTNLRITSTPTTDHRILDHWDNLDRTVERGYAGFSIWDWHRLPDYIDTRYKDYARANASVGINGAVLTNVNANARVLTKQYLEKVAVLAKVFRPYGIKVFLTARFSAPVEIGGLKTADPLNSEVVQWWKNKANEIYELIPDFGGFLVKANSEGQPGPQNYERNHADGANMLADAVGEHGGMVMWRAFVYTNKPGEDRFKQAYEEFKPLDGKFRDNVWVQVKNGPIDFQPREPFHPLFGAMPRTQLAMEFQLTQEYLGFATHLVFLPVMFREVLHADTFAKGKGTPVASTINAMAAVANIGSDRNWCGHPFGQANWYGFGRLAWNHYLEPSTIADEWTRQTFSNNAKVVQVIKKIMMNSYENLVNYMTPLGLHHIMGNGHHYGPAPWSNTLPRADWNPVYFHRADNDGIGFNRTSTGSNALEQYAPGARAQWESVQTCPDEFLLWFHRVRWDHTMKSGKDLWTELCSRYDAGVNGARAMQQEWKSLKGLIDEERFNQVSMLMNIQVKEAEWWKDACLLYFQSFSRRSIPEEIEKPDHTLEYYKSLSFPHAPGNW